MEENNTNTETEYNASSTQIADANAGITTTNTPLTLIRTAFDREAFNATINTAFTELGVQETDLGFFDPNLATVEDFFNIYNNLFFIIPKLGDTNSHEFLIKESSEYIDYAANQVEIQALLEEIADLRETNLQLQVDMAGLLGAKNQIDKAILQANAGRADVNNNG